jgi:hypothetical protein
MVRTRPRLILLAVFATAFCAALCAQTDPGTYGKNVRTVPAPVGDLNSPGTHVKSLPAPQLLPTGVPFAIDKAVPDTARFIHVRSAAEMTSHDRDLEADAESSIQERAGFQNLEFNEGTWTYQQLDCQALPNHLFLRFSRNDGPRAMSMFSAAIPRNGEGRIHIIPIVRKGYSLFSPAPIGPLTIAAFNRIRAEENADVPAGWLGTGLCYAALAGANPQARQLEAGSAENGVIPLTISPTLDVLTNGGAVIRFADVSATPRPMEWNMTFDGKGKLLKATHAPAYVMRYRASIIPTVDLSDHPAAEKKP